MTLRPVLTLGLGLVLVASGATMSTRLTLADDGTPGLPPGTPSQAEVDAAHAAALGAARDVDSVRAALVVTGQRLEAARDEAARAGEAFNGTRYRAQQARREAAAAQVRATRAAGDVGRQRAAYADTVTSSLQLAPELTALSALGQADGIDKVLEQLTTLQTTTEALDSEYDSYRATGVVADVAREDAVQARAGAVAAAADARRARDAARRTAEAAASEAAAVADERDRLIGRLARLEHVSKQVAQERQERLEAQAAAAAQQAAQEAAEAAAAAAAQAAQEAAAEASASAAAEASASVAATASAAPTAEPTAGPATEPTAGPTAAPTTSAPPTDEPTAAPTDEPTDDQTTEAPAPSSGAAAAIAFARAQIGEPYVWGAAGPSSWDCSGLTMGAWEAGGISLPHYSVAQYDQSTPISLDDLRPGDLVFWGSSSSPSSIYHVALYSGDGMIIQAPRTGETVREGSMYEWRTPDFFARP